MKGRVDWCGVGFFAICLASAAVTVTTLYKLIF
jgi:hypothetical protein